MRQTGPVISHGVAKSLSRFNEIRHSSKEERLYQKCIQLLHLADYHGVEVDLVQLAQTAKFSSEDFHRQIFEVVLNHYEKMEVIRQQREDREDAELFARGSGFDSNELNPYNSGELRNQARWEMERHLRFVKPAVSYDDAITLLAEELHR